MKVFIFLLYLYLIELFGGYLRSVVDGSRVKRYLLFLMVRTMLFIMLAHLQKIIQKCTKSPIAFSQYCKTVPQLCIKRGSIKTLMTLPGCGWNSELLKPISFKLLRTTRYVSFLIMLPAGLRFVWWTVSVDGEKGFYLCIYEEYF